MKEFGDGGWIAAHFPNDLDGEQMPFLVDAASRLIFSAANYSGSAYCELSAGASRLVTSFGNKEQITTFVPKILSGEWQGTMALTEPQAGSSLSDISTIATPAGDGLYKIKGQKIFISAGDHNGVSNVIHLMIGKIEGAPPGVKGISLFIVPKMRPKENGELTFNDVMVSALYHKLGYRGAPITELSMGENNDCVGYLLGEPNKGLAYMFQMMNEARLGVGLGATAIATASYYTALEYAKERPQGRKIGQKDPTLPQVPIIEHADVKRMLLFQRSIIEGSLSILMQCSKYADLEMIETGEEKERNRLLLEVLTPVAKSYPSEMGVLSASTALQCLGGYGYCDDFLLEQYYRDIRTHPIHEGTTGIQGMDLLGRKVMMEDGKAFMQYIEEVSNAITKAKTFPAISGQAGELAVVLEQLQTVTGHLGNVAKDKGAEIFLSDATLYLEYFSIIAIVWQWLIQAMAIQRALKSNLTKAEDRFYNGKFATFLYFFEYELPKTIGLAQRLMKSDGLTVTTLPEYFED